LKNGGKLSQKTECLSSSAFFISSCHTEAVTIETRQTGITSDLVDIIEMNISTKKATPEALRGRPGAA
jgi:hypothetical protein